MGLPEGWLGREGEVPAPAGAQSPDLVRKPKAVGHKGEADPVCVLARWLETNPWQGRPLANGSATAGRRCGLPSWAPGASR